MQRRMYIQSLTASRTRGDPQGWVTATLYTKFTGAWMMDMRTERVQKRLSPWNSGTLNAEALCTRAQPFLRIVDDSYEYSPVPCFKMAKDQLLPTLDFSPFA